MRKRREKLRALMAERGIPAALITKPENMRYLTGYTGEGAVYLDQSQAAILTDFRYVEQAGRQAGDCPCLKTDAQRKLPQGVKELLGAQGGLAVETGHMTVKAYRELESALPGVELMEMQNLPEALRMVKEPFEQDKILRASEIACRAFDQLLGIIGPGMTELEVRRLLDDLMVQGGSEEAAFSTIACAGVNGSLPHAVASEHRLEKGELLTLDFGAQVEGYKTDMTRTVAIGPVSGALEKIYDTVLQAQLRALEAIQPGKVCRDIDQAARRVIDPVYPGAFGHGLGHGVGLEIHEAPNLSPTCDTVLETGHVVTVEPGVYIQGLGGCRIEDTVILRPGGYVNVITAPKELITL